jgi:hypothetical protein
MPIKLNAVNLCALSAHTLPLTRNLSNVDICASRAASAAALNLFTLCCGVSPGGPGCLGGVVAGTILLSGFAEAWGVVGVNRVASVAERGILKF